MKDSNLLCVYDCRLAPLSFDFVNFVAISLCVGFSSGYDGVDIHVDTTEFRKLGLIEKGYGREYSRRKAASIFGCVPRMSKYVRNVSVGGRSVPIAVNEVFPLFDSGLGGYPSPYYFREVELAYRKTNFPLSTVFEPDTVLQEYFLRGLRARNHDPERSVCFHLRQSTHNHLRNPPYEKFSEVKRMLVNEGVSVISVRDVDDLNDDPAGAGMESDWLTPCSFSPEFRLALASTCALNITWGGGFCHPFWYSPVPFLSFGILDSSCSITTLEKFARCGPTPFQQLAWFGDRQIFDWTDRESLSSSEIFRRVMSLLR